ncbi:MULTISPECIES: thioesterase family protein [unclassified Diaminobutyricimonas]|uniref:acyl-CoA thioesterase n=1 Tax=unclassified Diaminobutyricimonas TaxID=2643261 RepID=UPI0012F5278B|nr:MULTISPECIES: thioesterase family protein [unclassified Diaminobutyricimonas]
MARLHVPIRVRWSDLDAYGHVNNASMLRLLEEARIQAFWLDESLVGGEHAVGASTAVIAAGPEADTVTLIARQEIEYLGAVPYLRQPLDVQLWIGRLGGASLDVCYEVCTPLGAEPFAVYARATTTVVLVDSRQGTPRRISAHEREAWLPYVDEPVKFKHAR